jgi:predicted phosphohydrolase
LQSVAPLPNVWAIADTHLSFGGARDQTRFGAAWIDHPARLRAAWESRIAPEDIVLLPGDLSWAHTPNRAEPDIAWIAGLPGHKILARGNHDFWWKKLEQVNTHILRKGMYAVQGSCVRINDVLICGTMGHIAPNDPYFQSHKLKSYRRELHWLRQSLEQARSMRSNGEPVLLMMHYPPFTSDGDESGFTEIIQEYGPDVCVYGHLHFDHEWARAANGLRGNTRYHLVAADYLNMIPRQVWPPDPD